MGNKNSSMLQDEEIQLISEETGFSPAQIEWLYSRFKALDKSGICGSLSRQDFLRVPELAINPLCDRIVHMFFADCDDDHDRINFRQFMKVLAAFRSSAKPTRSRPVSRQESIQNILSSLSQNKYLLHSRHSSCDDFASQNGQQQHHYTTNQHSFHYVGNNHNSNHHHGHHANGHHHHHHHHHHAKAGGKLHATPPHSTIDPDEPANSRKQKLYFMFKIYDVNDDDLIDLEDLVAILKMMVGTYVEETRVRRIAERTLREADKDCDGYIDFEEFCVANSRKDIEESLRVNFQIHSEL